MFSYLCFFLSLVKFIFRYFFFFFCIPLYSEIKIWIHDFVTKWQQYIALENINFLPMNINRGVPIPYNPPYLHLATSEM